MAGYREITVASEGRVKRPVRGTDGMARTVRSGGYRHVAVQVLRYGFEEGKVLCRERPGTVFGGLLALMASAFISVNALTSQKGRHPAPILPKVAERVPAPPSSPPRDVAKEPVRDPAPKQQAATDAIGDLLRAEDTTASVNPRVKPVAPAVKPVAPAAKPAVAKPTASPSATSKPDAAADAAVTRAQRALAKLGYGPIKADGAMGPATKAAIEKFERDHKLPVTGEAVGRTLKALETGAAKG